MSPFRRAGYVEPTLTPEEEAAFYAAVPRMSAPVNVPAWAAVAVLVTILVVLAAFVKCVT